MIDIVSGDVVVCVDCSGEGNPAPGCAKVALHKLYRVENVISHLGDIGLVLIDHYSDHYTRGYLASSFRKAQKADEGFTAWMKSCRPKSKTRVDA